MAPCGKGKDKAKNNLRHAYFLRETEFARNQLPRPIKTHADSVVKSLNSYRLFSAVKTRIRAFAIFLMLFIRST